VKHKHHIIPRHVGGTDDPSNLLELTVEEHAEAHRILYEEHGRWQDELAWKTLSGQISLDEASWKAWKEGCRKGGLSSRGRKHKEESKRKISEGRIGENNPMYGKNLSEEHKRKLSVKNGGENNPMYGKKHSDEMIDYLSEQRIIRHKNGSKEGHHSPHTDEAKEKLRRANKEQFSDPVKKEKHRQAMIKWNAERKRKER
jgi:hypothetical protein